MRRLGLAALGSVSLLLLLPACREKPVEVTVVAPEAVIRNAATSDAPVLATLKMGDTLAARLGKLGWKTTLPDGTKGFLAGDAVAPFPIAATPAFVVAPFAARLPAQDAELRTVTGKFPIGTKVEIVRGAAWLKPEFVAMIEGGKVTGFLIARTIADEQPTAPDLVAAARADLLEGNYDGAVTNAERAHAFDPKDRPALALAAALRRARGDVEAGELEKKLAALPGSGPKPPAPRIAVEAGKDAFVGASTLALRKAPSTDAPVLARLSINTPVSVVAIEGEWAHVRWEGTPDSGKPLELDLFGVKKVAGSAAPDAAVAAATAAPVGAVTPDGAVPLTDGWLAAGYLSPVHLEASGLAAEAKKLIAAMKPLEAVGLLERRVALAPHDAAATKELLAAALQTDQFLVAAYAALALAKRTGDLDGIAVDVIELAYGCRGDVTKAAIVSPQSIEDEVLKRAPRNACAVNVDVEGPCDPCDEYYEDYDPAQEGDSEEERQARAAERAAARAEAKAESERMHQEEVEASTQFVAKLVELFPSGPMLHVRLRNRTAARTVPRTLQVYSVPVVTLSGHDEHEAPYSLETLKVEDVKVPSLGPQESLELWIPVPEYIGMEYGIAAGESAEATEAGILATFNPARPEYDENGQVVEPADSGEEEEEAATMPPHQGVSNEAQDCSCGGC